MKQSDKYVWKQSRCLCLEAQNVSGPYVGWADRYNFRYLFHDVSGDLIPPPSGMRSSVPLGGEGAVREMCLCDLAVFVDELVILYSVQSHPWPWGGLGTSVTEASTQCKLVPTSRLPQTIEVVWG